MVVTRNIHRKLIARLLLGWVVLSVVLGVVVFFVKLEEIDDFVEDLALAESKPLLHDKQYFSLNATEQERGTMIKKLNRHIEMAHFIAVELYNAKREKLYEVSSKDADAIEKSEKYIESKDHSSLFTDNVTYNKFFIGGRIFLQFVVPLFDNDNKKYGYFEGVYRADDHTMKDIRNLLTGSLLIVVLAVFVTAIIFYPIVMSLNKDLIKLTGDLSDANIGMLESLGSAIAKRDSDTNSHNYRVTIYAVTLGAALSLKEDEMRSLIKGSFLHDIGKIAISDNILLKPDKLTEEEFDQMKTHVLHGIDIVGRYAWLTDAVAVVVYHHEKYDGNGYLGRLAGEDIPITARIFSIADVFDALTSKRPYKEPYSYEKSIGILKEGSGKHFDPELLEVFIGLSAELYDKTSKAEDTVLEKSLRELVRDYF
ncbi:HD-GYP domain-containing protein [Candidatus Magnetominusculus dajiuhuensis]|uniref:HD-GYP domain-containing protein n=1 Tax=Candidatus Magnetominusculus dajiuhuensis TaxID=3137712 RepID=UPI003B434E6B